jgi:hypothetical protein
MGVTSASPIGKSWRCPYTGDGSIFQGGKVYGRGVVFPDSYSGAAVSELWPGPWTVVWRSVSDGQAPVKLAESVVMVAD